jgi:HlyD family secretion protein
VAVVLVTAVTIVSSAVGRLKSLAESEPPTVYTVARKSFPVLVEAKGELEAKSTTDIKSKVEGRSTIIWVIEEGSQVEKGELLVRLASDEIEERITQEEANEASAIAALEAAEKDLEILIDQNKSDIRKAELKVELAEIDRKKYLEGDAKKSFMDAELEIERAEQMLERATLDCEAAEKLYEQKYRTKSEWLQAKFNLEEAERTLEKARLSLKILTKYTHPKELRQKDSDVEEAKKDLARVRKSALAKEAQKRADVEAKKAKLLNTQNQLKKYREQREYCEIRAPAPGLVVYDTGHRWDPRKITEGSEVFERQTIVTLPDPSVMNVVVRIHEANTNKIDVGQDARVTVEGIPDTIFTGTVTKIAPLADSRNRWLNPDLKEYETEITLDESGENLKPGMTARVDILVSELADTLCVPVQAVFGKGGRHYVFKPDGNEVEPVEVTVGQSSTEYVEIVEGVEEGGEVMLAISEDATRLLPELPPVKPSVNGKPEQNDVQTTERAGHMRQSASTAVTAGHDSRGQGPS